MSGTTSMTTPTRVAKLDTRPRSGPRRTGCVVDVDNHGSGEDREIDEDQEIDLLPQLSMVCMIKSTPCTRRGRSALAASSRVDATFAMRSEMVRLQTTWARDG
jgi:hypothetical protein